MNREQIYDMLREVLHPGKGDRNIVELGMVNAVTVTLLKIYVYA